MEIRSVAEIAFSLLAVVFSASCSAPAPLACPDGQAAARVAKVFYATDRQPAAVQGGVLHFGRQRSDPPRLHMGWQGVTVGPGHRLGKVDAAITLSPAHERTPLIPVAELDALRRSDAEIAGFIKTKLRPAIRAATGPRHVMLYIHGYNTSFDDAVRRTAQLASDVGLITCAGAVRGVAIAYSWPAQQSFFGYLGDAENAEWTQQRLVPFLRALSRACQDEGVELHLVAYSMGARALARSLAQLAFSGVERKLADHVILLAPDMEKGVFHQYVQRFFPLVRRITIYVSARDQALSISRFLHSGHGRLGLLESTVLEALEFTRIGREDHRALGFETAVATDSRIHMIDVTEASAARLGHSYEGPEFIRDLAELIQRDTPPGVGARANLEPGDPRDVEFDNGSRVKQVRYFRLPSAGSRAR